MEISKRDLYDRIMLKVAKAVKDVINDELNEFNYMGVETDTLQLQKMSDFTDLDKPVNPGDVKITKTA